MKQPNQRWASKLSKITNQSVEISIFKAKRGISFKWQWSAGFTSVLRRKSSTLQRSALPGYLGNGMTSLMLSRPVRKGSSSRSQGRTHCASQIQSAWGPSTTHTASRADLRREFCRTRCKVVRHTHVETTSVKSVLMQVLFIEIDLHRRRFIRKITKSAKNVNCFQIASVLKI